MGDRLFKCTVCITTLREDEVTDHFKEEHPTQWEEVMQHVLTQHIQRMSN